MEGVESKVQSQGQDSQIMSENVEGFQQCVKEILSLIEQDEDFFKMTPEIYDCKKSKLTKLVTDLSCMYELLTDEHVHSIKEVGKKTHEFTTPIKTEHVDSFNSTSPQVNQTSKTPEFMTPVDFDVTFNASGGGFHFTGRDGSKSSFTSSSDSKSESFMSVNKNLNSPVKDDASKVKQTKLHESKVLLDKISTLEKEQYILKKNIQNFTNENAFLEDEKANVAELKLEIIESSRRIKAMVNVLEASRQQALKAEEENKQLRYELSREVRDVTDLLEKQFDEEEARNPKLHEKVSLGLAEIAKRDEQITELNAQINLLKNYHATEEDKWNTDIEKLKTELMKKCEIADDLNQKHDDLMSYRNELKAKVAELEEKWIRSEM